MNKTILANRVRQVLLNRMAERRHSHSPVDAGDDVVHSEGRVIVIILPPDLASWPDAIVGAVEGIVEGDDNG